MTDFDHYVIVDWSASSTTKTGADSIWIADHRDGQTTLCNPATRRDAERTLIAILESATEERTLVGVDASLGYPAGAAALFGFDGTPWSAMWAFVASNLVDDDRNANNRFAVAAMLNELAGGAAPFWGVPKGLGCDHLATKKPAHDLLPEFRHCEEWLRSGGRRPASGWQLLGAGSVGSQTLTLLPVLDRLRARCGGGVEVWPFTTGLTGPEIERGGAVICEVWPTVFDPVVPIGMIRDAAQVDATAQAIRAADENGTLGRWFAPDVDPQVRGAIEHEEGWVLAPLRRPDDG